jgi:hypothetical protein
MLPSDEVTDRHCCAVRVPVLLDRHHLAHKYSFTSVPVLARSFLLPLPPHLLSQRFTQALVWPFP